jgi:non-ribosomal peptide synthetase component F
MGDLFTEITQAWADAARAGRSSVPVVTGGAYALSAAEAGAAIRALTVAMDDRGVPAGAAVLHVTARRPDWALVVAGLISSHRVWLPAPPGWEQIKLALRRSGARWVVAENPAQLELITAAANTGAVWCAPAAGGRWQLAELAPGEPDGSQKNAALPAEAAYLIPTSGSTGNAKWVVGSRRGLEHFIRWELGLLGTEPGTNFAQLTPATFDPVLREIFVAFASRGCLCVPGDIARSLDPVALADWLDATGTGVLHLTPTLLRALLPVLIGRPPLRRLGHLLLAGEELFHGDVAELAAHYGSALRIYNLYGPTETTLAKFCHRVTPDDLGSGEPGQRIPVGTPISGATAIRLAPAGTPCLPGEVGEIYIRTAYRSLGYLGTSRGEPPPAFTPNPFSSDPAEVVFAPRDLAYCRADGSRDAAVRPYRTAANHTALAAYVVSEDRIDANALRRVLRDRLISQEVPAAFVHLAELPKTTSGKVDHAALPVPANERTGAAGLPADDLTEFEQAILRVFASVMPAEIGPDDELLDVGGQSIEAARFRCARCLTTRARGPPPGT